MGGWGREVGYEGRILGLLANYRSLGPRWDDYLGEIGEEVG